MWADLKKGVTSRIFRIFVFKSAYLQNYSNYTFETRYDYSPIYYTRWIFQAPPTSYVGVETVRITRGRKTAAKQVCSNACRFPQEACYSF